MFRNRRRISRWWLVLAILCGLLIGGLVADFIGRWLPMAKMGLEIGNMEPLRIDTNLLKLELQLLLRFNLGSVLGLLIGILVFRFFDK